MLIRRSAIFIYMMLILFLNVILDLNWTKVEVRFVFLRYFKVPDIRIIIRNDSLIPKKQKQEKIPPSKKSFQYTICKTNVLLLPNIAYMGKYFNLNNWIVLLIWWYSLVVSSGGILFLFHSLFLFYSRYRATSSAKAKLVQDLVS